MRLAVEDGEDVFGYIMWFAIDVVSQSMGKMSNCGSASGFLKQALFFECFNVLGLGLRTDPVTFIIFLCQKYCEISRQGTAIGKHSPFSPQPRQACEWNSYGRGRG